VSLRHVVPTLGALALVSAAPAIEVGDLTIGGFVDTIFYFQDSDGSGSTGGDDSVMDFMASAELQFGYKIGDKVNAQVDLELDGEADTAVAGVSNTNVEQAFVSWAVSDQATLTLGKVETLIGYEAVDAPDLWRVGTSVVDDISPGSTTGLNVGFAPSEQLSVDVYIVDGIYDTDASPSGSTSKLTSDLSFGLSVVFTGPDDKFFVDFDFALDANGDPTAADSDITYFGVNGEFSGVDKLTLFGELGMTSFDNEDILSIMLGANYTISDTMSATAMLSNNMYDTADVAPMEIAVALLTNPTGDSNFAVNYELSIYMADDSFISHMGAADDATTVAIEFLAVIP
jgi:hypothetical protein